MKWIGTKNILWSCFAGELSGCSTIHVEQGGEENKARYYRIAIALIVIIIDQSWPFCVFVNVDVPNSQYVFDGDQLFYRVHTLCLPTTASLQEVIQVKLKCNQSATFSYQMIQRFCKKILLIDGSNKFILNVSGCRPALYSWPFVKDGCW